MKARAVVFTDKLKVEFREVAVPEPGPHEVVLDLDYSWISIGTESSFLRQERIGGEVRWKEGDPSPFPHVPGYQKTGTIRHAGAEVRGLKPGDRVFATSSKVEQMVFPTGGHVSPAVTHSSQVWKLPEGADPLAYCGMVLTQVGYNCGQRAPVAPGSTAVVIGDGLVGQWTAQTLLHRGADVIVLGRHDERLAYLAPEIRRINAKKEQAAAALSEYDGLIHIVADTVGAMDTFHELQPLMARESHLVSAGFLGERGLIDIQGLREQEITLHCPSGATGQRMDATLAAIQEGWLRTIPLITHRFPVQQAAEAWSVILDPKQVCLGVILEWPR